MSTLRVIVKGIVQGVSFRYFTYRVAKQFDIKGNVKNLYNGDVEIYAQAKKEYLDQFLEKIKLGPPAARVDDLQIEEVHEPANYDSFKITY